MLYTGDTAADGMLALRYDPRHLGRGVRAAITLGVDPDAVNDGQDGFPAPASSPSAGS
ncbi:hypothetical protein [Streptomyces sp. NPDC053560]|uniref:hypothetical protein n=1 Tax=Streptomyces sp. NPDC053560 TaxID=3365711 RepID=UPI0037D309E3